MRHATAKPIPAKPHTIAAPNSNALRNSGWLIASGGKMSARSRHTSAIPLSMNLSSGKRRMWPSADSAYAAHSAIKPAITAQLTGASHVPARADSTITGGAPNQAYQWAPPTMAAT